MKTFIQLQEEVLRYFDLANEATDNPTGADVELVKAALNQANQNRSTEEKWKFMLSGVYTLNVVSSTQEYMLPHEDVGKLQYLWSETHKKFITSLPIKEIPYSDVDFQSSLVNTSISFDMAGYAPVKAQPSAPDTLTMTSSVAETNSPTLYIEGEDEDGASINETIAVGGTTTQEFAKVTYIAKIGDYLGTVTIETTGGEELLVLTVDQFGKQYPVLKFYNIPTENEECQYRYYRNPRVMSRDHDQPNLPFPAANVLVYDALLDLATFNELDSESVNLWREKQQACLTNLYLNKFEGDTVNGIGELTNPEIDRSWA